MLNAHFCSTSWFNAYVKPPNWGTGWTRNFENRNFNLVTKNSGLILSELSVNKWWILKLTLKLQNFKSSRWIEIMDSEPIWLEVIQELFEVMNLTYFSRSIIRIFRQLFEFDSCLEPALVDCSYLGEKKIKSPIKLKIDSLYQ